VTAAAIRVERQPLEGEGLEVVRLVEAEPPGRAWVAKRLDPRLRRERVAYEGPLRGAGLAPEFVVAVEEAGALWIVLEDAGSMLRTAGIDGCARGAGSLAARIHALPWKPARRLPWPRPEYVVHSEQHVRGEWRIAFRRIGAAAEACVLDASVVPRVEESAVLFDNAWRALIESGYAFAHGDLHAKNLARDGAGALRAIDWSQWGWAPRALDLIALAADMSGAARDEMLRAYLAPDERPATLDAWRAPVDRAPILRIAFGLGALAESARRGGHTAAVRSALPRRLAQWSALRAEAASWK